MLQYDYENVKIVFVAKEITHGGVISIMYWAWLGCRKTFFVGTKDVFLLYVMVTDIVNVFASFFMN